MEQEFTTDEQGLGLQPVLDIIREQLQNNICSHSWGKKTVSSSPLLCFSLSPWPASQDPLPRATPLVETDQSTPAKPTASRWVHALPLPTQTCPFKQAKANPNKAASPLFASLLTEHRLLIFQGSSLQKESSGFCRCVCVF